MGVNPAVYKINAKEVDGSKSHHIHGVILPWCTPLLLYFMTQLNPLTVNTKVTLYVKHLHRWIYYIYNVQCYKLALTDSLHQVMRKLYINVGAKSSVCPVVYDHVSYGRWE